MAHEISKHQQQSCKRKERNGKMANAILRGTPNARNLQRMVLWGAHRQNRGKGVRICGNAISAVFVVAGALLAGQLSAGEKPWTEGPLTVDKGDVVNLNGNSKTNWFEGTAAGAAVTLHGDMNVAQTSVKRSTGWAVFVMENGVPQAKSPYIELAPDAGDSGVLTLDGAYLNTYYNNSMRGYLNIGSNGGRRHACAQKWFVGGLESCGSQGDCDDDKGCL